MFGRSTAKDETGRVWVYPRYGAAVTPGVVADIIRGINPDSAATLRRIERDLQSRR